MGELYLSALITIRSVIELRHVLYARGRYGVLTYPFFKLSASCPRREP